MSSSTKDGGAIDATPVTGVSVSGFFEYCARAANTCALAASAGMRNSPPATPPSTTAKRSAAPTVPSPVGLSNSLKAVPRGSGASHKFSTVKSPTASHSPHSMAPLPSVSSARAKLCNLASGTCSSPSKVFIPLANSSKPMRPSPFSSRITKSEYHGIGKGLDLKALSDMVCEQAARTTFCIGSKLAKRMSSMSTEDACAAGSCSASTRGVGSAAR
mmetsp:Transcript_66830/g.105720  ORF Transcript_66830/g.105720 Transcript_66830/m.105720 type:complete len:216 (+) Transcript_66830:121-768(+)